MQINNLHALCSKAQQNKHVKQNSILNELNSLGKDSLVSYKNVVSNLASTIYSKFLLLLILLSLFCNSAFAYIEPSPILEHSPNLQYEVDLLHKHNDLAQRYNDNYDRLNLYWQPANKTENCIIGSDLLSSLNDSNPLVFWEGSCKGGYADGFGRLYVIHNGRKIFELLANYKSEDPDLTTTYFYKDTRIENEIKFFYGKSNRFKSSGITITRNTQDSDLIVSMEAADKVRLVNYLKQTSKNNNYILNIMDLGNYQHLIHDLTNSAYRSLAMSYKLLNVATGNNLGYNLLGLTNGELQSQFIDDLGEQKDVKPLPEVIAHVQEINEEIELSVEDSIKNVIEALPVVDAYLNVICDKNYNNPVCRKMQCKLMCDTKETITPDDETVKALLLRLVDHHNRRPIKVFLDASRINSAQETRQQQQMQQQHQANPDLVSP